MVVLVEKDKMTYLLSGELFFIFEHLSEQLHIGNKFSIEQLYQAFSQAFDIDKERFSDALDKLMDANIICME